MPYLAKDAQGWSQGAKERIPGTSSTTRANRRGHGGAAVSWGKDSTVSPGPQEGPFSTWDFATHLPALPPSLSEGLAETESLFVLNLTFWLFLPGVPTSIFSFFLPTFINLLKLPLQILSEPCSRRAVSPVGHPKRPV